MGQGIKVETQKIYFFIFLNSESSFNNLSIITKILQGGLKTLPERSMSQNFDLGSRHF